MTPQQLLGTAIRLFAIWLVLSSVAYFSAIPTALSAGPVNGESSLVVTYVVGALYVIVAALLWFFPMAVSHKLMPRTNHTNLLDVPGFELARAGVGVLGLWLVAKALPSLSWVVFRAFLVVDVGSAFSALSAELKVEFAVALFELFLGVVFVVKAGTFASVMMRGSMAGDGLSDAS